MNLQDNKELFESIISETSLKYAISEDAVKKDYYVTLLLKDIISINENIIFKGGTSLSKAWHVINRFSEDIDLTCELHPTEGERRKITHDIKSIIEDNKLLLTNEKEIKSKVDHNIYKIKYDNENESDYLKDYIQIETSYFIGSFPSEIKKIASYIYDYLKETNKEDIINKYSLEPFEIRVQSLERTFIDKVFAICDYEIRKAYNRTSRHIYDLYKLYPAINMDNKFKKLIEEIRLLRREKSFCESAKEGININIKLKEVIQDKMFKSDYIDTTSKMFFRNENTSYDEAITVIDKIINSNLFIEE